MNFDPINFMKEFKGKVLFDEPLSKHTRFGVGGPVDVMFSPRDIDELSRFLKKLPSDQKLYIVGAGSNLLVRDNGIRGFMLKLDSPFFKKIEIKETLLTAYSGCLNASLKKELVQNALSGIEFLCSIPGTIGGTIKTNAGCYGKSVSDVLIKATAINRKGEIKELSNSDFHFSYRHAELENDLFILSVTFKCQKEDPQKILQTLQEQHNYRKAHQPMKARTAGSTFKNPTDLSAWKLIKESGAEHLHIGGASVSEKHCNFLINNGTATAEDIEKLGEAIIRKVQSKKNITLEWEIERLGQTK